MYDSGGEAGMVKAGETVTLGLRLARGFWALQTFGLLLLLWVALDGVGSPAAGAVFAALGTGAGWWLAPGSPYPWRPWRILGFGVYFLRESVLGGADVAWRALHPRMPLERVFIELELVVPPGLPRTVLVGVISLLPGTLSVSLESAHRLTVHALTPRAAAGLERVQREVLRLFHLETRGAAS
jgi:multicomponent Na+:H+ antiporter subunit E